MNLLVDLHDSLWLYVAAPILIGCALWVSFVLRAPQLTRLGHALSGLRTDPEAEGETTASAPFLLGSAATLGAAAAVGAASAVTAGGAGVLLWVWAFAFFLAPLRYAEVMLARTDVPTKSDRAASGSLSRRLMREGGKMRGVGLALLVLLAVTGFAFIGGVHGDALAEVGAATLPSSVPMAGYGAAALAAVLVVLGIRRGGALSGYLALAAILALIVAGILGASGHPDRAIGTLGRMFSEALSGAPPATPWVGASWQEIAVAALIFIVPPLAASGGVVGGLHGAARAKATRQQASTALLGPLLYAAVCTVLVMAFVGSGAYFHRTSTSRSFGDVLAYEAGFETRSQREEPERLYSGYMRIVEGELRDMGLALATPQATIEEPRFEFRGNPADVALHLEAGRVTRMLRPRDGTLTEVDLSETGDLVVLGEMIPRGGDMVSAALERGSGDDVATRIAFIAILLLLGVGAGAFGLGLGRGLPNAAPAWATPAIGLLPALGLAAAASGVIPNLALIGGIAAAVSASAAALAVAARARQAS